MLWPPKSVTALSSLPWTPAAGMWAHDSGKMLLWHSDRRHRRLAVLFLCVAVCAQSILCFADRSAKSDCGDGQQEGKTLLWKIRRKTPSFLFGTIHVPYTQVWHSVSAKIRRAFQSADQVMFELIVSDPSTAAALSQCKLLPGSQRLRNVIPRDLFRRIKRHLLYVRSQMPAWLSTAHSLGPQVRLVLSDHLFQSMTKDWERMRPIWVLIMINSLTEQDVRSRGIPALDVFLLHEAERLDKETGAVEQVTEQCNPLNALNSTHVLFLLHDALMQHEAIRSGLLSPQLTAGDDVRQYICGEFPLLDPQPPSPPLPASDPPNRSFLSESRGALTTTESPVRSLLSITGQIAVENSSITDDIDSYFRTEFMYKRNEQMARRIVHLLRQQPDTRFFFAFGAAHFLGQNSVITFVQEAGFRVERVTKSKSNKKRNKQKATTPLLTGNSETKAATTESESS